MSKSKFVCDACEKKVAQRHAFQGSHVCTACLYFTVRSSSSQREDAKALGWKEPGATGAEA